jgi:hypothetical protein
VAARPLAYSPGTMSIERRIVLALIKIPITACVMLIKVSKRNSVLLKVPPVMWLEFGVARSPVT